MSISSGCPILFAHEEENVENISHNSAVSVII